MYVMKIAPGKDPKIISCDCSLKTLHTLVGGYIKTLPLARDYRLVVANATMVFNKDCKALDLPYNPIATSVASLDDDKILGTALVVNMDDANFIGFDDEEATELVSFMEYDLNIEVEIEGRS